MTTTLAAWLVASLGGMITWLLLAVALKSGVAWRIAVDRPNQRSLHERAVPRIGGLAVVSLVIVVTLFLTPALRTVAAITVALMIVSAIDDRRGLPVAARLATHVASAMLVAFAIVPGAPFWLLILLVLALVWSMNLYNFMDGADGLGGGMAVFGFGTYAIVSAQADAHELAVGSACAAGAAAGFLVHNFPPARVFLGDAGSVPLGFLAAALGMAGWLGGLWAALFPLLVFAPFVIDATLTLATRLFRGERVWEAHRGHLYQRMVRAGLGHRGTALIWYAVMAISSATAIVSIRWPIGLQIGLLVAWAAIYASVAAAMQRPSSVQ